MSENPSPGIKDKLKNEIRSLAETMLYFGAWIGMLITIKTLVLAQYSIEFRGFSMVVLGALILSKVVLVLEHVSLGDWVRGKPAIVDVVLRTALYGTGVLIVLILEAAFEGRHEAGGFGPSLRAVFQEADRNLVVVDAICLSGALLGFNVLTLVRRRLGPGGLTHLFLSPMPDEEEAEAGAAAAG